MSGLDQLLTECVRSRGPVLKRSADDGGFGGYRKVWDAFNRYLTAVVDKRQTLNILNFCKIGWRIEEEGPRGQPARLRPHFQLAENFMRVYGAESRGHPAVTDKNLTVIEEFNFSKAAIRFSHSLTKENIFMGLRGIVQHLGETIAKGESMSLEFEVGKLFCSDRDVGFNFARDLYIREGLSVPEGAVVVGEYKPSVSFAPPSKDALSLSLRGRSTVKADNLGGWDDESVSGTMGHSMPSEFAGSPQEVVQNAALTRHLQEMETEAVAAMTDKQQWEAHLQLCIDEERKESDWRRALNREHSELLKEQMHQAEDRRIDSREHCILQASCHDFPSFKEVPEAGFMAFVHERRAALKDDLDQQVLAKQRIKESAKDRERMLERYNIEASRRELDALRKEALQKKEAERAQLRQAWAHDNQLKVVKQAIREHHKAPGNRADISELVAGVTGGNAGLHLQLPASQAMLTSSPRSLDEGSRPPSSRPITGSVRRMPLGAAASLALHKERMGATLRSPAHRH